MLFNVLLWKVDKLLAPSPTMLSYSIIARWFYLRVYLPKVLFNVINFFLQFSACAGNIKWSWLDRRVWTVDRRNFLYEALIVRSTHNMLQIISSGYGVEFCADSLAVQFLRVNFLFSLLCCVVKLHSCFIRYYYNSLMV